MKRISIIIPAHNEEKRIESTLKSYSKFFSNLYNRNKLDYDILVVINKTTDSTKDIVKLISKNDKKISYLDLERGGKGYAITEGFKYFLKKNTDFIGFVDADMSTKPEEFYRLSTKIKSYDGIIASRYIKGAVVYPKPLLRRIIISRLFNTAIRILLFLPYRDTQCGAKIFKKSAIKKVIKQLSFSLWAFDVDLIYTLRKNKLTIKEEPTAWSDKEYSKINFFKAGPWMFLGVLRLRLIHSPFRFIVSMYDRHLSRIWNNR